MKDKSIQVKEINFSNQAISSLSKMPKKSSNHKKLKGKKKLEDISSQISLEFRYEDFDQETESFYPQIYKPENKIHMENVSILDQSHFRFLIKQNSDKFKHCNSYNLNNFGNIKWNDIELVYFYCNDNYTCPICLESNLCCPVITKCGHVYCYPCIISLYNYHTNVSINKKIPNCPLCNKKIELGSLNNEDNESSDIDDDNLKLCQKINSINYNNDMKIKFNLILREKKSPILYNLINDPLLNNWKDNFKNKMKTIPDEQTKEFNFSRIFFGNNQLMNKRLNEYKSELNILKNEFDSTSDELKKQSIQYCLNKIDSLILKNKKEKNDDENVLSKSKNNNNKGNDYDKKENNQVDTDIDYKKYYLFYQEEKGDIYYLDPFIMDILLDEYGDYNSLPVEIEGKILDIKMDQVTSKLKNEYSYLNHMRSGSIIFFVEIDINDLISSSTKKKYVEKLYERSRFRRLLKYQEKNYEEFIIKKNIKLNESEKNSSIDDSKKSLENISGPIFFGTDEELGKDKNDNNNNEKVEKNFTESKLKLLLIEKEKEEKEKEKEKKEEKKEEKKDENKEKKNKKKKGGNKNKKNKGGKKGKKKKVSDIKEMVFNSENEDEFSGTDH